MPARARPQRPIGCTQPPDVAEPLEQLERPLLAERFDIEQAALLGPRHDGDGARFGRLERSQIRDADLAGCALRGLRCVDVMVQRVDTANADIAAAMLRRVQFEDCRLTGVSFADAGIEEVTFSACKLDYANFRGSRIKSVSFRDCVMTAADFQGSALQAARFEGCDMVEVDFSRSRMELVDLRGSRLAPAGSLAALSGAVIDSVQLVELAEHLALELGIAVRDD